MGATFSREIIGLAVVDSRGDLLGTAADMMADLSSGVVSTIVIELEDNIDATLLPWPSEAGLMLLPTDEIAEVSTHIVLKR